MSAKEEQSPKQVTLSPEEANALTERIKDNALTKTDIDHILGLISFNLWLQQRLSRAKLTIKKLRQLFGFKPDPRKKSNKSTDKGLPDQDESPSDVPAISPTDNSGVNNDTQGTQPANAQPPSIPEKSSKWDENKNHGRYSASDYTGCRVVDVPFEDETLQAGQCPNCLQHHTQATLYTQEPTVLIVLDSQPLVCGTRYQLQKARCSVCQTYFTASAPATIKPRQKYTPSCITSIAINHYTAGLPFKRLEMLQSAQGVPLADATQYDLMSTLYDFTIKPVAEELNRCAANGDALFFDDTPGCILEQIQHNRQASHRRDRHAVHATALISEYQGHRIYLFSTSTLTAGKEFAKLMQSRTSSKELMTMTDASASNFTELDEALMVRWVICLCLVHGRRHLLELFNDDNKDVALVLDIIAKVYQHESHCKRHQLNDQDRLIYHQTHSAPLMAALYIWFNNLLLHEQVEPNSRFGEAIAHMLKRWHWLTQFLRVPGAALDNNICEQAIKVLIRYRKNSYFYRTAYGASVGDAMMSVLHTAAQAQVSIFEYLNLLQEHQEQVRQSPADWLPWTYAQTLAAQNTPHEEQARRVGA